MRSPILARTRVLAVGLLSGLGLAIASPMRNDNVNTVPDPVPAAWGSVPDWSGGTRTVDLLIELQSRRVGLEFNERPRPLPDRGTRSGLLPAVPPKKGEETPSPSNPGSGLFGVGATPMVASPKPGASTGDGPWKTGSAGGGDPPPPSRSHPSGGSGSSEEGAARLPPWPRELIRFVRDHREWVIGGAIALLATMWGGSMALGRRGR